jgi:hypothetical protein
MLPSSSAHRPGRCQWRDYNDSDLFLSMAFEVLHRALICLWPFPALETFPDCGACRSSYSSSASTSDIRLISIYVSCSRPGGLLRISFNLGWRCRPLRRLSLIFPPRSFIPDIQRLASWNGVHFRTQYFTIDHPTFLTFATWGRLTDVDRASYSGYPSWHLICSHTIRKTLEPQLGRQVQIFNFSLLADGGPHGKGRTHS